MGCLLARYPGHIIRGSPGPAVGGGERLTVNPHLIVSEPQWGSRREVQQGLAASCCKITSQGVMAGVSLVLMGNVLVGVQTPSKDSLPPSLESRLPFWPLHGALSTTGQNVPRPWKSVNGTLWFSGN